MMWACSIWPTCHNNEIDGHVSGGNNQVGDIGSDLAFSASGSKASGDLRVNFINSRALYLEAARRKDAGMDFTSLAAMAKLTATDSAMKVTTDAIQVFGGAGYTRDFPVERYFREAKVLQIVEGTNQVQRLVIGRSLGRGLGL